jgi:hypothetical protein
MVLPDSHRVSRVPRYSGAVCARFDFAYRAITLYGQVFQPVRLSNNGSRDDGPTTPHPRTLSGLTYIGLGCFPFARRYLGNHYCFLFLRLLRCFSSPRSPQQPMYSAEDVATLPATGFPIQKSPDQSLFSSSPKLIAAFHVFHRLLTPRHPPFALNSLATKYLTQMLLRTQC